MPSRSRLSVVQELFIRGRVNCLKDAGVIDWIYVMFLSGHQVHIILENPQEDQEVITGVDVDRGAEPFESHCGALGVPARPAVSERRGPENFTIALLGIRL